MKITLWNVVRDSPVLTVSNLTLRIMDYFIERIRSDKHTNLIISFLTILAVSLLSCPLFISILFGTQVTFIGVLVTAYMFTRFIEIPFEDVRNLLNSYDYLLTRCFRNLFNKRILVTFKIEGNETKRRQIRNLTMNENSEDFWMNRRMNKWLNL